MADRIIVIHDQQRRKGSALFSALRLSRGQASRSPRRDQAPSMYSWNTTHAVGGIDLAMKMTIVRDQTGATCRRLSGECLG